MALAGRQASWQRDLSTLRLQYAGLRERATRQGPGAPPAIRISVGGMGQSLVDVDSQIGQARARVEAAIDRGEDAGSVLEQESSRVQGYLQALRGAVASVGNELDQVGAKQPQSKSTVE